MSSPTSVEKSPSYPFPLSKPTPPLPFLQELSLKSWFIQVDSSASLVGTSTRWGASGPTSSLKELLVDTP